jgi:hypothetical protein
MAGGFTERVRLAGIFPEKWQGEVSSREGRARTRTRAGACITREGIGPDRSYWVWDVGRGSAVEFPAEYWEDRRNSCQGFAMP